MSNFIPTSTNEMVFSNEETKELMYDILQHNITFPSNGKTSLLLYGVYGSGKTTYANIFFNEYEKSFGGDNALVENVVVDGNEKITTTIDRLTNISSLVSFNQSNKHYFLFDEVDGYNPKQQQRLKGWLNRDNVVCVLTTNHINDIDKGLRSRCFEIDFNASANTYEYVQRMKQIIHQHKLHTISDKALFQIAEKCEGDWRNICATLQRVCSKVSNKPPSKPNLRIVR